MRGGHVATRSNGPLSGSREGLEQCSPHPPQRTDRGTSLTVGWMAVTLMQSSQVLHERGRLHRRASAQAATVDVYSVMNFERQNHPRRAYLAPQRELKTNATYRAHGLRFCQFSSHLISFRLVPSPGEGCQFSEAKICFSGFWRAFWFSECALDSAVCKLKRC